MVTGLNNYAANKRGNLKKNVNFESGNIMPQKLEYFIIHDNLIFFLTQYIFRVFKMAEQ